MNSGTWLGAIVGTAVLALVLVLSASLEPQIRPLPGKDAAAAPTSGIPTPEATFPPGPVLSGPITLYEAPERVQHIELAPGETVDQPGFFYFWDVETGAVDGWGPPGNPEFPFPMFDAVSSDSRFVARIRLDGDFLLVDRSTAAVYSYNGSQSWPVTVAGEDFINTLVSYEDGVLFYTTAGDLAVIEFGEDGPQIAIQFKYPEDSAGLSQRDDYLQALFSPDGSKLALLTEDVRIFDLSTGLSTVVGDRPLAEQSLGQVAQRRIERSAGSSFVAYVFNAGFEPGKFGWARYGWDGTPLGGGNADDVSRAGSSSFSPDGQHVAWRQAYLGDYTINALVVADLASGEPLFRVLGLNLCDTCPWLDGERLYATSGVELEPQTYSAIVTLDGAFTPSQQIRRRVSIPNADEVQLLNEDGEVLASRTIHWDALQGPTQGSIGWDEKNGIVRFSTPLLGRDGGGADVQPFQPKLELPPFAEFPTGTLVAPPLVSYQPTDVYTEPDRASERLGVLDGGYSLMEGPQLPNPGSPWLVDGWWRAEKYGGTVGWVVTVRYDKGLHAEPSKDGEVLLLLEYPVRLTYLETVTVDEGEQEPEDAYWRGGEVWARVRLEDGTEGWILLHAISYL